MPTSPITVTLRSSRLRTSHQVAGLQRDAGRVDAGLGHGHQVERKVVLPSRVRVTAERSPFGRECRRRG